MPSMLIVEPHSQGHHMHYACWISREAVRLGFEVRLATSESTLAHPAYVDLIDECGENVSTIVTPAEEDKPSTHGPLATARLQFHYHRKFSKLYSELDEKPDYAFIPSLDYCFRATAVAGSPFGPTPWGGLALSPTFHLSKSGVEAPDSRLRPINERLFFRLLSNRPLKTLLTLDESLVDYTKEARPALAGKVRFVPEPASLTGDLSRAEAREKLRIPRSAVVMLVYGVLDHTKGINELLEGAARDSFPEEVHLLFAGRQDDGVRELLSSPRALALRRNGRLHTRDEHLHGEDEYTVFQASDIVWVGYRGQLVSSGVLLQAAIKGLPVIACKEGLIGWLTRQHGMGVVVDTSKPNDVAAAARLLARDSEPYSRFSENSLLYGGRHDVQSFGRAVSTELKRAFPIAVRSIQ